MAPRKNPDELHRELVEGVRERKKLFITLDRALSNASDRASFGKGWTRHGNNLPFQEQDIVRECNTFGIAPNLFQIRKKARELYRFEHIDQQIAELQDIIVYAAASIVFLESNLNKKGGEE